MENEASELAIPSDWACLQYLGAAIFFTSLTTGLVGVLVKHRSLPSLDLDCRPYIEELLERDGPVATVPHLVTATKIDYANASAVTRLFNIARGNRDLDVTVFAVQEIVRREYGNARYRRIFVEALLRQGRGTWRHYAMDRLRCVWTLDHLLHTVYQEGRS